jgi:glycosyltransferase involved in cell wall biosynthesis
LSSVKRAPRILALLGSIPLHGHERGSIEALDALRSTGCDVLVLIRGEWTQDTVQAELDRRGLRWTAVPYFAAIRRGVGLRTWVRNFPAILAGSWSLLRLVQSHRASHIHTGNPADVLNFLPALAITRTPLVYRCGDVPMAHHALWRWVWRFTRRRASFFAANCEFLRTILIEQGVPAEKVAVIYNRPTVRQAGKAPFVFERGDHGTTFVYVGQLTVDKGVGVLVDAAIAHCARFPAAVFLLLGDYRWRNPFARGLIERVRERGLRDRIHFTGYREDVYGALAAADVHLCPSIVEPGLPNVVLEAKTAGVPSVVFASGGLPELIEDGVDGWVCREKTAAALQQAMAAYERDPTLARRQGEAARRSLARLGVDDFAARWRALYDRVC